MYFSPPLTLFGGLLAFMGWRAARRERAVWANRRCDSCCFFEPDREDELQQRVGYCTNRAHPDAAEYLGHWTHERSTCPDWTQAEETR